MPKVYYIFLICLRQYEIRTFLHGFGPSMSRDENARDQNLSIG